jgi:uncharacterized protein Smg (DUF494 family)
MSERIREIIDYIMDLEPGELRDPRAIEDELESMGYSGFEIRQAFSMLDLASHVGDRTREREDRAQSRVLSEFEKHVLSVQAQGYLLGIKRLGLISEVQLGLIIDNAAYEFTPPVSLEEVKELASRLVSDLPMEIPPADTRRDGQVH